MVILEDEGRTFIRNVEALLSSHETSCIRITESMSYLAAD